MRPHRAARRVRSVSAALLLALGLAAPASQAQSPPTVRVWSSLPLQGASASQTRATVNGMRLALAQAGGMAGEVRVRYTSLDDSTAAQGTWDPNAVARNARRAAREETTVAYLGEFNSGATAISLPILNQLGIPQISPSNTYDGLTAKSPGTDRGEPGKYSPSGARTFMRLLPRDAFQADAIVARMQQDGCTRVAIAQDGDTYGSGLGRSLELSARARALPVALRRRVGRGATSRRSFASAAKQRRAGCVVYAGVTANGAVPVMGTVARVLPGARLYGADGICESGFTNPRRGGVSRAVGRRFTCFVAVLALRDYPGGAALSTSYRARFGGGAVAPYAIVGYEAMQLVLDTLRALGPRATDRSAVLAALLATRDRSSSIGTYSFDANGDTTNHRYGVYRVRSGDPVYAGSVTP